MIEDPNFKTSQILTMLLHNVTDKLLNNPRDAAYLCDNLSKIFFVNRIPYEAKHDFKDRVFPPEFTGYNAFSNPGEFVLTREIYFNRHSWPEFTQETIILRNTRRIIWLLCAIKHYKDLGD